LIEILRGFGDQIRVTALFQKEATIDRIMDALFGGVDLWHFNRHGDFHAPNPLESCLVDLTIMDAYQCER